MTPERTAHYRNVAKYHKASLRLLNMKAAIHVEDKDDEEFWDKLLKKVCPGDRFRFITYSRTEKGHIATGCSVCLLYRDFLDDKLAIAIDSDLRYLRQQNGINASNYILQTYTYSFENHLCFPERLSEITERITGMRNDIFNYDIFLKNYSREIYPLFLMFLYASRQPRHIFPMNELRRVINMNLFHNRICNNGESVIELLKEEVRKRMKTLNLIYPHFDEYKERIRYSVLGLNESNAYLYIRGHNIFNLMISIGNEVCNALMKKKRHLYIKEDRTDKPKSCLYYSGRSFKNECMKNNLRWDYPEIQKCLEDISSIWK